MLIVHVGSDLEPKAAFLVHIDERWIERVLRTLTKQAAAGTKRLDRKMAIRWRAEDRIEPGDGAMFAAKLREHIGDDPAAYAARKQSLIDKVGYNKERFRGEVKLEPVDLDDLAEFAVWRRPGLPVRSLTLEEVRFDIAIPDRQALDGTLKHSSPPVDGRARTTITSPTTGVQKTLHFDAVSSASFPMLPLTHHRVVLRHPVVQIGINSPRSKLSIKYALPAGLDSRVALRDIGPAAEFVAMMAEPVADLPLEFQYEHRAPRTYDLHPLLIPEEEVNRIRDVWVPIANAWAIARSVGLVDVDAIPRDVVAQAANLRLARAALERRPLSTALTLSGGDIALDVDKPSAIIGFVPVLFTDAAYVLAVTCIGRARIDEAEGAARLIIENGEMHQHAMRVHDAGGHRRPRVPPAAVAGRARCGVLHFLMSPWKSRRALGSAAKIAFICRSSETSGSRFSSFAMRG